MSIGIIKPRRTRSNDSPIIIRTSATSAKRGATTIPLHISMPMLVFDKKAR